ncbi:MAG: ATP-binding cassette domain-containing protein [Natronomonas sp.]
MSDEPLLRTEGLKKHYESEGDFIDRLLGRRTWVKAVDGVDIEIGAGETLGLVGESGCGKSTVGRTLLGLEDPTAGRIYFDGEDITHPSAKRLRELRQDVQIIFQNPASSLNPRLTVDDIIGEALDIHGLADGTTRDERIKDLLRRVGLKPSHANRYPHEFSGGQLQRIGIARALAVEPKFIVCDEPVSALDVSVQAQILNLLSDLQDDLGVSYLFIAHDLSVVEHIADRIAVMYLGKIAEVGTPAELFSEPQHPYTEALLSAIPEPDPAWEGNRIILEGTVPSPIDPPDGCRFHTRCPKVIPPAKYDFRQPEWRAVLSLRERIAEESVPLGRIRSNLENPTDEDLGRAIRDHFDVPECLSDPDAEAVVSEALDSVAAGRLAAAERRLSEAFPSPCSAREPELRDIDAGRAACHLYDPRYRDGTVEDGPSDRP